MMRLRYLKRGISVLFATTMLLSVFGCAKEEVVIEPMEIEEVYSLYFDALGGKDVMPISGYYGPRDEAVSFDGQSLPDQFTDEMFQNIAGCGVNMIHHTYTNYQFAPELTIKMLELGEKYGIGICVQDSQVSQRLDEDALSLEELDTRINEYSDYPAFAGLYIVDEPGSPIYRADVGESRYIERYKTVISNLGELGVFGSVNMLPPNNEQESKDSLKQFLDDYCANYNPQNLSWDYYLFDKGFSKELWFYTLDTFSNYADKYEIPLWVYVQAGSQWNDGLEKFNTEEFYPTEGELLWNVNILLASGVKGLEYFPLVQPFHFSWSVDPEYNFQRNGLIGAWGNKTQWWYYAQKANAQVAAVDHVLMNSVCKGVITTGEQVKEDTAECDYLLMDGTSWRELADVQGNAYIGCFNYQGKSALYVVNYETEYAQKITLKLHDSYDMTIIQNTEESHVNTKNLTLDMKAGEGALIVFD